MTKNYTDFKLIDSSGNTVIDVTSAEKPHKGTYKIISDNIVRSLITTLPSLTDGTYRVTFSPTAMAALQRGEASFRNGYAVMRDSKGQILKHPEFVNTLSPAQFVSLGFTLGSMLFAQQHLADIASELANIKENIQKIITWQENTDISPLKGCISWLQESFFRYLEEKGGNTEWQTRIKNELFQRHSNMYDIQEKLILEVNHIKQQTDNIFDGGNISKTFDTDFFGTKTAYTKMLKINEDITSYNKKYELFVQAVMALNVAIKIVDPALSSFSFFRLKTDLYDTLEESLMTIGRANKIIFSSTYKLARNAILCQGLVTAPLRLGHHLIIETRREKEITHGVTGNLSLLLRSRDTFRQKSQQVKQISMLPQDMIITINQEGKIISGETLIPTSGVLSISI
ncbi:hypothetical protein PT277_04765 [Acetobacteraceae bacterium ESL0709]|nr:hypothetical protein [Acetobacteraceae bacterium ESL0697]MDF7678007.1 hypothetical protein [Acetobacteraceae bacterium ESL0709]